MSISIVDKLMKEMAEAMMAEEDAKFLAYVENTQKEQKTKDA